MKKENKLALIVAYYLSKYDKESYKSLGFKSFTDAFNKVGESLSVNPNSVKNMRDEFDSVHSNGRLGWYQRELRPSRKKVIEMFQDLDEESLREIILEIIGNSQFKKSSECLEIIEQISENREVNNTRTIFALRGPTGRKAEEFFIGYYLENKRPVEGELIDKRDHGCGYDFEIVNMNDTYYVEVKGLAENTGGILFTNKEWSLARKHKDKYYLVLVKNLNAQPKVEIVNNPAHNFCPKKTIYTVTQISWSIDTKTLNLQLKDNELFNA